MRCRVLVYRAVNVFAESSELHTRRARESRHRRASRHENALPHRAEFADGHAIACDYERCAPVQGPHDPSTIVAEFALCNYFAHCDQCSTGATPMAKTVLRGRCTGRKIPAPKESVGT